MGNDGSRAGGVPVRRIDGSTSGDSELLRQREARGAAEQPESAAIQAAGALGSQGK